MTESPLAMKILFTAFKGENNTSFQLVSQLGGNAIFLTNSFQGLGNDISSIDFDYDIAYMFGVDKNLTGRIRIETCAQYSGETVYTDFDIMSLEEKLKDFKISYSVSNKPAGYLCNAAYYHMLKKNSNTVFMHIPSQKGMDENLMNILIKFFD